jgi:hypothetical protein
VVPPIAPVVPAVAPAAATPASPDRPTRPAAPQRASAPQRSSAPPPPVPTTSSAFIVEETIEDAPADQIEFTAPAPARPADATSSVASRSTSQGTPGKPIDAPSSAGPSAADRKRLAAAVKQREFRNTIIPICLTLGVTLPLLGGGFFLLDPYRVIRSAPVGVPITMIVAGVVFLGLGFLSMKQNSEPGSM